jgi:hypothetical protein
LFALGALASAAHAAPGQAHEWKTLKVWCGEELESYFFTAVPASLEQSELRYAEGDDPRWARPDWDDAQWQVKDREYALPKNRGIFWLRIHVRSGVQGGAIPLGLFYGATAAAQFFWDGRLVQSVGQPGASRAAERAGPLYKLFDLPPGSPTGPGEHVMAVRMSTYRFNRPDETMSLILVNVEPSRLAELMERSQLMPMLGVGALLVIALAAGVFWIVFERRRGLFFFSAVALGGGAMVFLVNVRLLFPVPYSWSYSLWTLTEVVVILTVCALVALVAEQVRWPRRRWLMAALTGLIAATIAYSYVAHHHLALQPLMRMCWNLGFVFATALALWGVWRRARGAWPVFAGIAISGLVFIHDPDLFLWGNFPLAILPTLLGFMFAIGRGLRREQAEARETKLTAARLELELLRKSLQPHFLMNTLTALAQVIEENPRQAVRLIDDLADELRTLAKFAQEKRVPLESELDLCRTHLRVMSVRTERIWDLEVSGIDPQAHVPPAVFFTLIENGFTHQEPIPGSTRFHLKAAPMASGGVRYDFHSPGRPRTHGAHRNGGGGLRYIKARLNESWNGRWQFEQQPAPDGWRTVIELRSDRTANGT